MTARCPPSIFNQVASTGKLRKIGIGGLGFGASPGRRKLAADVYWKEACCVCHHLLEGFVDALRFILSRRPSVGAAPRLCCACLCICFRLTLVRPHRGCWSCRSRLLRSGYLVAGGYVLFFAAAIWSLADTSPTS